MSKAKIDKDGFITAAGVFVNVVGKAISNPAGQQLGFGYTNNGCAFYRYSTAHASFVNSASVGGTASGLNLGTDALGFASSAEGALGVVLLRDGADNTLALRNGAAAQTFNVYGTYTSGTSYERLTLSAPTSANAIIGTNKGSGGGTARGLDLHTDGAARMTIGTTGNVGIGTTAPGSALHISGALGSNTTTYDSAAALKLSNTTDGSSWLLTAGIIGVLNGSFSIRPGAASLPSLVISNTGNVGIGTTAPSQKLDVAGAVSAGSSTNGYQLTNGTTRVSGWGNNQGSNGGLGLSSTFVLGWSSGADGGNFGTFDTILQRDGETDHLAMRRTTNGQKFSVYGTYPGAAWERFTITAPTSGNVLLGTYKGTGGIARGLEIQTDGVSRWTISTAGHFLAAADNTYDIGASGANRPRNVYAAGAVIAGGLQVISGGGIQNSIGTGANIYFISGASRLAFDLGGGVFWNDSSNNPLAAATVGVMRNATGILEVNSGTLGAFRDVRCRSVIQQPPASITPASNGDYVVEATNNTTLTFRLKGSDGVVRSATLTLAP